MDNLLKYHGDLEYELKRELRQIQTINFGGQFLDRYNLLDKDEGLFGQQPLSMQQPFAGQESMNSFSMVSDVVSKFQRAQTSFNLPSLNNSARSNSQIELSRKDSTTSFQSMKDDNNFEDFENDGSQAMPFPIESD